MSSWFVYILKCADKTLYTGVTTDLKRRLSEHNAGTGAKYTRARLPVKMVWHENSDSESTAKSREYAIKKLSRQKKNLLIKE